MAYLNTLFNTNFLEYASYVIKDRAIPHINDGLKPVQRRILHSMHEMDDGKFNKVANVVGHCMKYHPHGDASIFSALVVLANKELFIDKQGNYGNIATGDEASAARYIECRLLPLANEVLFNPEITQYEDSYDARNREPITFPAKIPVILAIGAEGIAVGMATKILPHNIIELMEAQIAALQGEQHLVYPDFSTGGLVDVSEYNDGNGKVLVRARLDASDPKRIVIREIPFGTTTESLMSSIEDAARKNKIKIASINDYTAENVEIELKLARGVQSQEVIDSLYAFTDCEYSISVNMMLINHENKPIQATATEVIAHCAAQLVRVLQDELNLEMSKLLDKLHARTLEQIFIENRIYKRIEEERTTAAISAAVHSGLKPFAKEIGRAVSEEDIEVLLRIPIRRISRYDIERAQKEMREMNARIKEIKHHLAHITDYAIGFLERLIDRYKHIYPRTTQIVSFTATDVREAAQRNLKLRYDKNSGYLGHEVNGNVLFDVSDYDRILIVRKSGAYSVVSTPDKMFVDKGMLFCSLMDKDDAEERVFSIIYKDESGVPYIKRCKIDKFILNKGYTLVPEGCTVLKLTVESSRSFVVEYKPKPRVRVLEEEFKIEDFLVKGVKASGVRLANREVKSVKYSNTSQDEGKES